MKKLITLLPSITVLLSIAAFSAMTGSSLGWHDKVKKEIKQLRDFWTMKKQEDSATIQAYIQEYATRKISGVGLLVISVLTAFFANGKTKRSFENKQTSENISASILTISSLAFVFGILMLVTADNSFNKSKDAYLNPLTSQPMELNNTQPMS